MTALHVQRHPSGPRLYVGGLRLHHGTSGCALALAALVARRPSLALAGLALALHDRHDARVWLRVERLAATLVPVEAEALP